MNIWGKPFAIALFLGILLHGLGGYCAETPPRRLPNFVLILADDLGYGDLGCYGAEKVKTPNIDRLAARGLRFTDAHAASASCTPSRYALLTGEYAWRKKGTGILTGDASLIIAPGRTTLPGILRQAGYAAGCVGKWHLGLGDSGRLDWNGEIKPGPLEVGFDSCFIIPATGDRVPCVFVENHRVAGLDPNDPIQVSYERKVGDEPTGREHPEMLRMKLCYGHDGTIINGISRIGFMSGGKAARWKDEDIADVLASRAIDFIEANKDRPFFLYFATHDVHVPRVPHPRFAGTSQCGVRGDVVAQFDDSVGQLLAALDRLHLTDNTLVICTSDNGPVLNDGYDDGADRDVNGHQPAGPLRGTKYTAWEGGTRVPFVVRWPKRIKPGVSNALLCQVDLLASLGALAGCELAVDAGPDSFNVLPSLLGETRRSARDSLVEEAVDQLGLRHGDWKLVAPPEKAKRSDFAVNIDRSRLYNLDDDLAETTDLAAQKPEMVEKLNQLLDDARRRSRTRPQSQGREHLDKESR